MRSHLRTKKCDRTFAHKAYSIKRAQNNITGKNQMTNFTVNQTTDDGTGLTTSTLSYAILQANQLAGNDTITINNDVRVTGV